MSFRDQKAAARGALFQGMKVLTRRYSSGASGPFDEVYVRVNSKIAPRGDLAGTSLSYAERQETEPRLIFLLANGVIPVRGEVYSVAADEAYEIDHLEPTDVTTVTAVCSRLSTANAATYAPPGA
jgi:hypothetical protein